MAQELTLTFDESGARCIYDDLLAPTLEALGEVSIARASHVEPVPGGWSADMSPVSGPVLGPFVLRGDALAAEVAWLRENLGL